MCVCHDIQYATRGRYVEENVARQEDVMTRVLMFGFHLVRPLLLHIND